MSTSQVKSLDGVANDEAVDDWNHVGNTITRVENETGAKTFCHQRQKRLCFKEAGTEVMRLEQTLCHLLSILSGIKGGLSDKKELITLILLQAHL